MKYAPWIALILALCFIAFQERRIRLDAGHHARAESVLKRTADSLKLKFHEADIAALKALTDLNLAKAEIATQKAITDRYRKSYHDLKNKPVLLLSDSAIDSELSALYPR